MSDKYIHVKELLIIYIQIQIYGGNKLFTILLRWIRAALAPLAILEADFEIFLSRERKEEGELDIDIVFKKETRLIL